MTIDQVLAALGIVFFYLVGERAGMKSERHRVYVLFDDFGFRKRNYPTGRLLGAILRGDKPAPQEKK